MTDTAAAHALSDPATDPFAVAEAAAAVIRERTGVERHDVALVLGSGWGQPATCIGETARRRSTSPTCPGFAHGRRRRPLGRDALGRASATRGRRALVFGTRTHFYEGRGVARGRARRPHRRRRRAAATVVLTNGCGGLRPGLGARHPGADQRPHQPHRRPRPIEGANFVDLTDLYSPAAARAVPGGRPDARRGRLRAVPRAALRDAGRGRAWPAPSAATWSACRPRSRRSPPAQAGSRCSASRWSPTSPPASRRPPLNHEEVLEAGRDAADRCGRLLADVVGRDLSGMPVSAHRSTDLLAAARAWRGRGPGRRHPGRARRRCRRRRAGDEAAATELADACRACWSSARPGCAGALGAGPEPDEPRRRDPRGRRPRGLPAGRTAPSRSSSSATTPATTPTSSRATPPRSWSAPGWRASCCRARCRPRCSRSRSATSAPTPASWSPRQHNPPQDNGYKVYLGDGSQIVPPADARDRRRRSPRSRRVADVPAADDGWETLGDEVLDAYLARAPRVVDPAAPRELTVVLHRRCTASAATTVLAGLRPRRVPRARRGREQAEPDPTSRPCPSPTPRSPARSTSRSSSPSRPAPTSSSPTTRTPTAAPSPSPGPDGLADAARRRGRRAARRRTCSRAGAGGVLPTRPTACSPTRSCRRGCSRRWPGRRRRHEETLTGFKWISPGAGAALRLRGGARLLRRPGAGARQGRRDSAALLVAELAADAEGRGPLAARPCSTTSPRAHGVHATDQLSVRVADLVAHRRGHGAAARDAADLGGRGRRRPGRRPRAGRRRAAPDRRPALPPRRRLRGSSCGPSRHRAQAQGLPRGGRARRRRRRGRRRASRAATRLAGIRADLEAATALTRPVGLPAHGRLRPVGGRPGAGPAARAASHPHGVTAGDVAARPTPQSTAVGWSSRPRPRRPASAQRSVLDVASATDARGAPRRLGAEPARARRRVARGVRSQLGAGPAVARCATRGPRDLRGDAQRSSRRGRPAPGLQQPARRTRSRPAPRRTMFRAVAAARWARRTAPARRPPRATAHPDIRTAAAAPEGRDARHAAARPATAPGWPVVTGRRPRCTRQGTAALGGDALSHRRAPSDLGGRRCEPHGPSSRRRTPPGTAPGRTRASSSATRSAGRVLRSSRRPRPSHRLTGRRLRPVSTATASTPPRAPETCSACPA